MVQDAGWASGPSWTGAENLFFAGIRSPDLTVHSESICYPAVHLTTPKCITFRMSHQSRGSTSGILLVVNDIVEPSVVLDVALIGLSGIAHCR
jgi:hypothetical protein